MSRVLQRPRKTKRDYDALPDDVRAELVDGELYVTPAPSFAHQDVVGRLYRLLCAVVDERDLGRVGLSPLDVHLPSGDVVQPDLLFVAKANEGICREWVHGAPDLVVEVVSSTHPERDRFVKRRLYARSGIPEYWIVDPTERSVEVLGLEGDAYAPAGWFTGEAALVSPTFPPLRLPLSRIFR